MHAPRLALAVFILAAVAASAAEPSVPRVHVLLLVDTDADELAESVEQDRDNMARLFDTSFKGRVQRLPTLQGSDLTPDNVLAKLRGLSVRPEDAVFVYYTGHGAIREGEHHLAFKHGWLQRSKLVAAMEALKPRLSVLLTDCCANVVRGKFRDPSKRKPAVEVAGGSVLQGLLFQHRGTVDINGCQPGACSWCDTDAHGNPTGGTFTLAFAKLAIEEPKFFGKEEFVTWETFVVTLRKETNARYGRMRETTLELAGPRAEGIGLLKEQKEQLPHTFGKLPASLAKPLGQRWKFGANLAAESDGKLTGFRVRSVSPGSPADAAGLRVDDLILSVDGKGFADGDPAAFAAALAASGGEIVVEYRRDGKAARKTVTLVPAGP